MADKNEKIKTLENAALEGAATEVVQRYGSAAKEHFVVYTGKDNETGEQLKRGLKDIAKSKVNQDYKEANLKQQAGFAAEQKYTARQNAESIINKEKTRVHNTDVKGSGDYDQLFDHIITDENGIVISQEQMKFVGSNPKACLDKLASKKFQKYFDADATITIPSDYYDGIIEEANKSINSFEKQLKHAKETGNKELEKSLEEKIEKYKKIKESLKDSGVSNSEAMEARLHSKLSTAKDVVKVAHRAGVEQAAYGATIGGGISFIKNTVAVIKGDKTPEEAGALLLKDTGLAAGTSYATAFSGTVLKGAMQNSESKMIQAVSKTNFAATVVTSILEVSKTMTSFIRGDIDGIQCLEELGEKGTSQLGAAMFAAAGQTLIPIPVVGGMIGSAVGYALTSACYGELLSALKDAKLAHEERLKIEKYCEEAIKMIIEYREQMNETVNKYLTDIRDTFDETIMLADKSIWQNDIDTFIDAANKMSIKMGRKPQFNNFKEFDSLMVSEEMIKL
ncbi:MAG: hypothetical protein IKK38_07960 [Spirochaetaceae bacterium]|nr:hypothetical protein [Spirochaetaceae bacterium]